MLHYHPAHVRHYDLKESQMTYYLQLNKYLQATAPEKQSIHTISLSDDLKLKHNFTFSQPVRLVAEVLL